MLVIFESLIILTDAVIDAAYEFYKIFKNTFFYRTPLDDYFCIYFSKIFDYGLNNIVNIAIIVKPFYRLKVKMLFVFVIFRYLSRNHNHEAYFIHIYSFCYFIFYSQSLFAKSKC